MGSSCSKPARTLASQATQSLSRSSEAVDAKAASAAAARASSTPSAPQSHPPPSTRGTFAYAYHPQYAPSRTDATSDQQQQASETRTRDIMRDALDPQLLQNLARLGAVHIPKHSTNYQPTDQMLRILAARSKASLDPLDFPSHTSLSSSSSSSSCAPSDRLSATTLSLLLDDRKHCETRADLEKLAVEYDLRVQTIEELARYFNSPTMGDEIRQERQERERDETASAKFKALWVEPEIKQGREAIGQ